MKRDFIPGVDVIGATFADGDRTEQWTCDEDGALRRSACIAARAFEVEPVALNAGMLADLEWQATMDRLDTRRLTVEEEAQFERDCERGAIARANLDASQAVGLVSVLSTQKRASHTRSRRQPTVPFRVSAERTAAVQAVGAFVAGGDEARMAKLRRSVGFAARAHAATRKGHRPDEARMVTLTYRDGVQWRNTHMSAFMDHVRKWHARHGVKCRYVWVSELQDGSRRKDGGARGAVHYHVLLWVPQGTAHMPMADKQGWWPHGSTRTEKADKAASYICSYLKKANSKNFGGFPDGCRLFSVGGLDHSLRRARRWLGLPSFVQGNSDPLDTWVRADGGGWTDPQGQHWPSEFRRINCGGVIALQRVLTHPRSFSADGPFTWLARGAARA